MTRNPAAIYKSIYREFEDSFLVCIITRFPALLPGRYFLFSAQLKDRLLDSRNSSVSSPLFFRLLSIPL